MKIVLEPALCFHQAACGEAVLNFFDASEMK